MAFVPLEQEQTGFVPLDSVEQNPSLKDRVYKKANALFREGGVMDDFAGVQPSANESDLAAALSILRDAELSAKAKRQGGVSNSDVRIVDGLSGVLEMGARQGYAGIGRTEAGLIKALGDALGSDTLNSIADDQMIYADKIERGAQLRDSKVEGFSPDSIAQDLPKAAASAIGSTIQTAPNLALAAVAPELVLPSILATSTSQEYGEGRRDGLTGAGAAIRAPIMGAFEAVGEKLGGMDRLASGLAKATRGHGAAELGSAMIASSAKELPGELFTTSGQFLTDKLPGVGTNQDAGLDEYAKQMKDTALTTLLQSAGMGAGGHVLSKMSGQRPAEQQADAAPEQSVNYDKVIESLQRAEQVATASREHGFQPLQGESPAEASNPKEVTPMAQPQEAATTPPPGQVAPPIQQDKAAPAVKESLIAKPETSSAQDGNVKQETEQTAEPAANSADAVRPHLEQLIKLRRVAGELGMPRQMDSLINKAKDGIKTGKIDSATFAKAAKLFKDKDARIYGALQGIAQANAPKPEAAVAAKKPARASGDLLQRIKQLGGIDGAQALDITGENRAPGGWRFAFKNGGTGLDDLATQLAAEGFSIDTNDVDGGVQQLRDMIRAHINGERSFKHADIEAQAEKLVRSAAYDAMAQRAEELGINWKNLNEAQLDEAVYRAEDDLRMEAIAEREAMSDAEMSDAADIDYVIDDELDIPFGDEVAGDAESLAAFFGEHDGGYDGIEATGQGKSGESNAGATQDSGGEKQARGGDIAQASYGAAQEDTGRSQRAVGEPQTGESEAGFLESYTEAELNKKEAARKKEEEATARRDSAPSPEEFTLTGSDRQSDIGAAHGQADILDQKPSAIEDFGEKILGARKEYAAAYKDRMAEAMKADVMAQPLSKSWPEPDYQKLVDSGYDKNIVGLVRSMRDEVPNKPGKDWKQKTWAKQVELLRETADKLLNDIEFADKFVSEMKKIEHLKLEDAINGRAELYALFGHEKSLKGVRISRSQYGVYNGVPYSPPKIIWEVTRDAKSTAFSNMPRTLGSGDTRQAAIDAFSKAYSTLNTSKEKEAKTKFELYADRYAKAGSKGQYFIGKKVGRNVLHIKDGFDTIKEAREYIANNNEELTEILEKKKAVPNERYDTNKPRVGQDMRNGQDVTPQMFSDAFGFRGVQFGNYVEGARRQKDLNDAYDALMDLAAVLDIPPKSISLNGELGLAFGARGTGGKNPASAHYEPGQIVINLTKGNGAGSLAHEWWHSLDNYFSRIAGKKEDFATDRLDVSLASRDAAYQYKNDGIRKEMIDAFGAVVKAINSTAIKQRSGSLDARRTKAYWGTGIEMSARSFERYVIAKLHDSGFANDYLANVVSEEYWNAADALGVGEGGSYPYPTESELPAIRGGFDNFFQAIESKETEKGVVLFSKGGDGGGQTVDEITKSTARLRNGWSGFRKVSIVQSVKGIPNDVYLRALRALQPINQATEGIYDPNTNTIYLIADNIASPERAAWVAAHEVVGHGGIRMLNKSVAVHVDSLSKNGTIEKLAQAIAKDRGDTFDKSIHVQEAIAELAAAHVTGNAEAIFDRYGVNVPDAMRDGILGVIARIVEAVRNFMAKVLSKPVSEVSDGEVRSLIVQMKDAADGVEQSDSIGSGRAVMASMSQGTRGNHSQTPDFPDTAKGKALEFLWKLTANDWMFRMPTSFKKDMAGIANEMRAGKFTVRELPTDTVPEDAARKWQIKFTVDGIEKTAYITEDHDKQIFIDVSSLRQDQRGSEIYQIAAAYAHNTGRVFVPDPNGISTIAVSRRIENLLSSALRYGTTKHLLPSNMSGLDWIEGDDLHNIEQMLDATIRHTSDNVALLDQVEYDFHTDKFILIGDENETHSNSNKVEFTARDFKRAAERSFARRDAGGVGVEGIGNTTLQRAVFARSVLRQASSGQGRQLLAEAYSRIQQRETPVSALEWLYYSNSPEAYKAVSKLPRDFDILSKVLPKHIPLVYDRDELGNIRSDFLGSRRLKDLLHASFLRPMAVRTGMAQANKELAKLMRSQKAAVDKAMRVASEVIDSTKGMTEEESALISRIVTEEMQPGDVPPAHAMKIAAIVERAMTEQGQEAVELQMLSKDAYEKWKGKYLPRFYMRHLDPEIKGIWQRTFKASPISGFRSGSLKGRGKRQVVTVQELPEWEALGWEVADKAWKKNAQGQLELTVEGNAMPNTDTVAIWKDYTPDERRDMGEVQDFRLRFVMGYLSMQRDIAIGRLYRQIASNPEWTRRTPSDGYSYIPITEIPDTGGLNRYGMLAGLYVKDEILSHISQHESSDNEFQRYYKAALSKWKEGKTVLNPVTHMNNFVSNVTMAHFAGVSYWDGEKYFFALKDLVQKAPMMQEAEDAGLFTGDFSHAEIMKAMPPEVRALIDRKTESGAEWAVRWVWRLGSLFLNNKMANAYHWGDVIFKYAIYRDARSKGMSPEDSVQHASKYIFNYDDLPKTARGIRDYGLPFFAYTYKVIPALASTAIEYPWRFAAPAVIISSINAISYAALAGDSGDDDWWLRAIMSNTMTPLLNAYSMGFYGDDEPKTAGQELEQEERKNLAEWDKGASAMGTQKTIRLGIDEKTGLPVFINVYRFIPGGDIQDVQNEKGGIGIPAPFMPSNPVLNAFSALVDNKNWDGKEMFDANDTGSEKAVKTADYLYKLCFPTIALGGTHYDRIMNAAANFSDTTIEAAHPLKDYTGTGKDGLPVQPKYAAMQTIGIKARPVDLEQSGSMNMIGDNAKVRSIDQEISRAGRLLSKGAISQREFDSIREKGIAKMRHLGMEAAEE